MSCTFYNSKNTPFSVYNQHHCDICMEEGGWESWLDLIIYYIRMTLEGSGESQWINKCYFMHYIIICIALDRYTLYIIYCVILNSHSPYACIVFWLYAMHVLPECLFAHSEPLFSWQMEYSSFINMPHYRTSKQIYTIHFIAIAIVKVNYL